MLKTTCSLALATLLALPAAAADPTAPEGPTTDAPTGEAPSPASTPTETTTETTTATATTTETTPAPAPAADAVAPAPAAPTIHERGGLFGLGFVVTPRVGGALGGLSLGGAGTTLVPSLELGYLLPLPAPVGRDLEVTVSGSYAAPFVSRTVEDGDPRLATGTFTWDVTVHQWSLNTGLRYRIPVPLSWLRPTAALALQTLMTRTVVTGDSAGERFPTTIEDAVDLGVTGALGADAFVGPGAISAELVMSIAPADHFVLQQTTSSSLGLLLGYRFFL